MIKRSCGRAVAAPRHPCGHRRHSRRRRPRGSPGNPCGDRHFRLDWLRALTLAKEAGLFKKNGLDVSLKKIPQKDRHLAMASGDIQCAATTVETWVVWNANGVAATQIFQLDKSYGADGMVVKPGGEDRRSERQDRGRPRPARRPTSRWPGC